MTLAETGHNGDSREREDGGHGPTNRDHPLDSAEETPENLGVSLSPEVPRRSSGPWLSYEVLRQVVYGGHIPRPETLFRILGSMQFSSSQVRKICGMHYGDYLPISSVATDASLPVSSRKAGAGNPESPADPGTPYPAERSTAGKRTSLPRRWRNRERSSPASAPPFRESRFPATRISGRWSKRWRESRSRRSAGAQVARRSSRCCSPGSPRRSTSSSSGRTGSSRSSPAAKTSRSISWTGSTTGTASVAPCWAPPSARPSAPSRRG